MYVPLIQPRTINYVGENIFENQFFKQQQPAEQQQREQQRRHPAAAEGVVKLRQQPQGQARGQEGKQQGRGKSMAADAQGAGPAEITMSGVFVHVLAAIARPGRPGRP